MNEEHCQFVTTGPWYEECESHKIPHQGTLKTMQMKEKRIKWSIWQETTLFKPVTVDGFSLTFLVYHRRDCGAVSTGSFLNIVSLILILLQSFSVWQLPFIIMKLSPVLTERIKNPYERGFPGGAVVENLPANAGDTGSSPGLGRSHMPQSD